MERTFMLSPRRIRLVLVCILGLALAVFLAGCSSAPKAASSTRRAETPDAIPRPVAPPEPTTVTVPPQEALHVSTTKVKGDEIAVITTNRGVIKFKFYAKDAPNTAASFIELADAKFFDGMLWHRVVPDFVIQGGDPLSKTNDPLTGTGGPGWRLKAEFNSRKHLTGTVALARGQDPDSGGSQFYITLSPQPTLDGKYTVFGQVTSGLDVVKKIQLGDVIKSVRIQRGK